MQTTPQGNQKITKNLPFIAAEYVGRKVTVRRSKNYEITIASIKKAFRALRSTPPEDILMCSRFEECDNDLVQITEELWSELLPSLTNITVIVDDGTLPKKQHLCPGSPPSAPQGPLLETLKSAGHRFKIYIRSPAGKEMRLSVSSSTSIKKIVRTLKEQEGLCPQSYRLTYEGNRVAESDTVGRLDMRDGDELFMLPELAGGKPVIYLFPPYHQQGIRVHLSLVDSWRFSALYPPTSIKPGPTTNPRLAQSVSWTVDASPDGTLLDQGTNREVSYLFWEAHTALDLPLTPISSRPGSPSGPSDVTFDPIKARLEPTNSALLPLDKVTAYIDDALLALGLHTEARTSFITYWLPNLLAHKFIALRFVPQDEYETAAPMTVSPAPDIVTRVFMIFQGVEEVNLEKWGPARIKATQCPNIWREIVEVDVEKAADTSLFRVLEWGGMEVK